MLSTLAVSSSPFLIVEDELSVLRVIQKILAAYGEVRAVTSIAGALDAMALHRCWSGLVLDFKLADGNGLDFLELARTRHPLVPALLVTGTLAPDVVNRAYQLGAGYLCKPVEVGLLRRFARDARGAKDSTGTGALVDALPEPVRVAVVEYARTFRLSPVETVVVECIATSGSRVDLMDQRDITENTYKTHVRHILRKTGESSVADVRAKVTQLAAQLLSHA
jgi:DNA-binding NarL/FixJ family response regulator